MATPSPVPDQVDSRDSAIIAIVKFWLKGDAGRRLDGSEGTGKDLAATFPMTFLIAAAMNGFRVGWW